MSASMYLGCAVHAVYLWTWVGAPVKPCSVTSTPTGEVGVGEGAKGEVTSAERCRKLRANQPPADEPTAAAGEPGQRVFIQC